MGWGIILCGLCGWVDVGLIYFIGMVRGYKEEKLLDAPNDNCTIYKVSKDGRTYLMHEFEDINDSDEYSFRVRKKLSKCSHLVPLL